MSAAPPKAEKKDKKWKIVLGGALEMLLYVVSILVGTLASIFVPLFIKWLLKKFKVEDKNAEKAALEAADKLDVIVAKAVNFGIGYAEEQAHKLRDNPVESAKKLDSAVEKANQYLKDSGVVEKGAEYLKALIEAKLGESRPEEPKKKNEKKEESAAGDAEEKPKDEG
jgi:hypothetical protein